MTTTNVYFGLSFGLAGCYMPDSHYGSYHVTTRKALIAYVKDALAFYDMPASCIHQVKWRERVWPHCKHHGASSLHFDITHKGNALHFGGLTEEEYEAANAEE